MNNKVGDLSDPLLEKETKINHLDEDKNVTDIIIMNIDVEKERAKASFKSTIAKSSFRQDAEVSYAHALKKLLIAAFPSIMSLMLVFINDSVNVAFAGKYLGSEYISAVGLGAFYVNATGFILGIGLLGAVDTICAQAYGAKQYYLLGLYFNISRICLFMFSLLISMPFVFFSYNILFKLHQSTTLIPLTCSYIWSLIPYIFLSLQYNACVRYLQSMNKFIPGMIVTLITTPLHVLWCYLLITKYEIQGLGYALGITSSLNFALISIYIHVFNPRPETYFFFDKNSTSLRRIYDYLKMGIPSSIMFCADWFGFEILILLSSYLDQTSLSANVILFNFMSLIYTIPLGLSFATSAKVGIAIGSSKVNSAKTISIVASSLAVVIVLLITIIVQLSKDYFPYMYTNDEEVAKAIQQILYIFVYIGFVDSLQIVLSGVIKGLGKQKPAAMLTLFAMYPVNIPMCLTLAFIVNYGLEGLWWSQFTSVIIVTVSYIILIVCLDWDNVVIRSIINLNSISERLLKKSEKLVIRNKIN